MSSTPGDYTDPVFTSSRVLFGTACFLVTMAGISLYLFSTQTDKLFAWTIDPPLTAAFMGAAYFSAMILQLGAAREGSWRRAGAILPGILVFTVLTLVATVIHIDKFHLDSAIGWIWVSIYVLFPPFGLAALIHQRRSSGSSLFAATPVAPVARSLAALQAVSLSMLGAALFALPATTSQLWPWALTPLTARAIGAWLVGMGVAAGYEYLRNDHALSRLLGYGKIALVVLLLVSLARYSNDFSWGNGTGWGFLLYLGLLAGSAIPIIFERRPEVSLSRPDVGIANDENRTPRFP